MKNLIPSRLILFVFLVAAHNSMAQESVDPASAGENCQQTYIDAQRKSNAKLDEQVQGTCKGDPTCQRDAVGAHNQRMAEARAARDACKDAIPKLEPMKPQLDDSVPDPPLKPIEPQFDQSNTPQPTPIPGKWVKESGGRYTFVGNNGQRWQFHESIHGRDGTKWTLDSSKSPTKHRIPGYSTLYEPMATYRSPSGRSIESRTDIPPQEQKN